MEAAGFHVRPYHANVPSFGEWGFVLASDRPFPVPSTVPVPGLKYLDDATMRALFDIPPDMGPVEVKINSLNNQALVTYYEAEWRRWN
mgnify:CR=1 FL=1